MKFISGCTHFWYGTDSVFLSNNGRHFHNVATA